MNLSLNQNPQLRLELQNMRKQEKAQEHSKVKET